MIALASDSRLLGRFAAELVEAPPEAPRLDGHGEADREAARLAWASRIFDEYRSVAIFAELLRLLADVEAPFAALCAVQRLIGDELRHTELTARVVDWLGGRADLAIDLADAALPRSDEPAAPRALRIVARELVVVEEESVLALAAYRDATTEPAIRAVIERVLADEVRHAATGRALLAVFEHGALADATAALRAELPALMAADRALLREDYRRSARGGAGRALGACIERADLERYWRRVPRIHPEPTSLHDRYDPTR